MKGSENLGPAYAAIEDRGAYGSRSSQLAITVLAKPNIVMNLKLRCAESIRDDITELDAIVGDTYT